MPNLHRTGLPGLQQIRRSNLTFVSREKPASAGTFYSVEQLAPTFQAISHANPFFYIISGFRYGFLGISDSPILVGALGLLALNVLLWAICYTLLRSGWKIKA